MFPNYIGNSFLITNKKTKMKTYIYLAFFAAVGLVACKKDKEQADTTKPTITVNSPVKNEIVKSGEMIMIDAMVEDKNLHSVTYTITNKSTDSVSLTASPDVGEAKTSFHIDKCFTPTVSISTIFELEIVACDHAENIATEKISFTVNP